MSSLQEGRFVGQTTQVALAAAKSERKNIQLSSLNICNVFVQLPDFLTGLILTL